MEFSDVLRHGGAAVFSPNGDTLAHSRDQRLTLRNARTMEILKTHQCRDVVQLVEWSSDSMYVLCANLQRAMVEVFSVEDPEWHCHIDEGAAGLEAVRWAPDGRHILTTAQFQLRITVWSLVSQHVYYIRFPKLDCSEVDFTADGKFMAVLERRDCKDFLSLFVCSSWQMVQHFEIETVDAVGLAFSPDGLYLAVWDSCLTYKVCIYSLEGRLCGTYSAYENALGIKSVVWSPSAQLLSIGSFDQSVRLLNNLTWQKITHFKHTTSVPPAATRVIFQEVPQSTSASLAASAGSPAQSKYEAAEETVRLQQTKIDPEKANPRIGIAWQRFSHDSRFLATRNDLTPNALWIWNVAKLRLTTVVVQTRSLSDAAWHPHRNCIALCAGGGQVYFWTEEGISCVKVPSEAPISISNLQWSPDGTALLLCDKSSFCVCHPGAALDAA